jgi:hypothetical protein
MIYTQPGNEYKFSMPRSLVSCHTRTHGYHQPAIDKYESNISQGHSAGFFHLIESCIVQKEGGNMRHITAPCNRRFKLHGDLLALKLNALISYSCSYN